MKQILKRFGEYETPEVEAVRRVTAQPGFAQGIVRIDIVDEDGNLVEWGTGTRPVGERYTLTDEAAALHDELLEGADLE